MIQPDSKQNNILIVDDMPDNLSLLMQMLTEHGYRVRPVLNGKLALQVVQKSLPDLILLDILMPGIDGYEVCRRLKAEEHTRDIPIIFISALDDTMDKVRAFDLGGVDYITKPFQEKEVLARVKTHLDLRQAKEEIRRMNATLEQRVIERTRQLEVSNKELEAFSYSVSHDLRSPLRSIDGFSLALLEDYAGELDAQAQDYLRRVRNASQRMGQLIDGLLKLSRLTRVEMRRETVDLSGLAQSIASELQNTQPERLVECVIAPGLTATGDAHLFRVVLENLLGNAWKFTSKRAHARIEFGVTEVENQEHLPNPLQKKIVFFVRDNGAGFDMAYADKLFGAFQRLHGTTEFPGTGIGLVTVQRIIHRHGGRVWAEGAVEQGATFYFTL